MFLKTRKEVGSRNAAAITAARPAQQEKTNLRTGFFYSYGEIGSQLSWYMIITPASKYFFSNLKNVNLPE